MPPAADVPDEILAPAVELAVRTARADEEGDPAVPTPRLRRFYGFAHLPGAALRTVRHILDDDDGLRARVAAQADERDVGRAGWLWLHRPEDWEHELAAIGDEWRERAAAEGERHEAQALRRRLEAAEAARQRAVEHDAAARDELERARAALAAERRARRDLEAEVAEARAGEAEQQAARTVALQERDRARALVAESERQVRKLATAVAAAERARAEAERVAEAEREAAAHAAAVLGPSPDDGLADALRHVADGLRRLADTVAARVPDGCPVLEPPAAPAPATASAPAAVRHPLPLPGGVLEESRRAAEHLLTAPGVVLLVDGYNVAMAGWPDVGLADQRDRLVHGLEALAARTGAEVQVVFDGAGYQPSAVGVASAIRVEYSPAGVEADDVLIDRTMAIPAQRPVVVASDDHRVREGGRRAGANLVGAGQLLALVRRAGGGTRG